MPNEPAPLSARRDIDAFLAQRRQERQAGRSGGGRLIFAADATASREPMWALACRLQADMYRWARCSACSLFRTRWIQGLALGIGPDGVGEADGRD